MARIQDIRAFEERIADAVNEYLEYPESYEQPILHVYLDRDEMEYQAEIAENLQGTEDDGVYQLAALIREENGEKEPDRDTISRVANDWIFLEH